MTEFIKSDLELHAEDIRSQLRECRDPQHNSRLQAELHSTMQQIADSRPPLDHTEEIESLRDEGRTGAADLLERQTRIQAAQARLHASQDGTPRELKAAQDALQEAQALTAGQTAKYKRDHIYQDANRMLVEAGQMAASPRKDERERAVTLKAEAEAKLQEFRESRVTH